MTSSELIDTLQTYIATYGNHDVILMSATGETGGIYQVSFQKNVNGNYSYFRIEGE